MRECSNCVWSISPDEEKEIMEEQNYEFDDPNRPEAGDCVLGKTRNENFVCECHDYKDGLEEYDTYLFKDSLYFGDGYLIIQLLGTEIVRFLKFSLVHEGGFPEYYLRGYSKNTTNYNNGGFKTASFLVTKEDNLELYYVLSELKDSLSGHGVYSVDSSQEGRNHFDVYSSKDAIELLLSEDIYGVKDGTEFINIKIGDNFSCDNYEAINSFYHNLIRVNPKSTNNNIIKNLVKAKNKE